MSNNNPHLPEAVHPYFDVVIVGAGLSGIGAAHHLKMRCPGHSFAIMEMRESMGGTWDLFRYPGVRSDSDMFTLGYKFRPWTAAEAIADGSDILEYIRETAREDGTDQKIRYQRKVVGASWSSEAARWTLEVREMASGETEWYECNFLFMCAGYYSYEEGFTPQFAGMDDFQGRVVHPQKWTEDIEYRDKRVVVIGSGATAVTLAPALAREARDVVMLQRSPSYILSMASRDPWANLSRRLLPAKLAHGFNRWRLALRALLFYQLARKKPKMIRKYIHKGVKKALPPGYDVDTHFSPVYNPWDQRLCLVPDNDLFEAIKAGKVEMVTDHIARFTENGIALQSGRELEADLIVTATGLKMKILEGVRVEVDGKPVRLSEHCIYRGVLLSDLPNLAIAMGYTNASWTLKIDLVCGYVCRLLRHMKKTGTRSVVASLDPQFRTDGPLLDFNSGYVLRAIDHLPRQGAKTPWKVRQNYLRDVLDVRYSSLRDKALEFK